MLRRGDTKLFRAERPPAATSQQLDFNLIQRAQLFVIIIIRNFPERK